MRQATCCAVPGAAFHLPLYSSGAAPVPRLAGRAGRLLHRLECYAASSCTHCLTAVLGHGWASGVTLGCSIAACVVWSRVRSLACHSVGPPSRVQHACLFVCRSVLRSVFLYLECMCRWSRSVRKCFLCLSRLARAAKNIGSPIFV
jgi:hypothetical protein